MKTEFSLLKPPILAPSLRQGRRMDTNAAPTAKHTNHAKGMRRTPPGFGVRWQSAAATPLFRNSVFDVGSWRFELPRSAIIHLPSSILSLLLSLAAGFTATAQTFTTLKSFAGSDGTHPYAGLTPSGNILYGTTSEGGTSNLGTVFRLNMDGTDFTVLKHFTGSDGRWPNSLTLLGSTLYGTTSSGGSSNLGTVFKVNTDGMSYTVLKNFIYDSSDGYGPSAGLTLSGSTLYGTTSEGGNSNCGTVFKLNTDGTGYTVLKHFTGSDGADPWAGLALSGSTLYGTTWGGGSSNYGTVFKVNTDGTDFAVLKHCTWSGGANPGAGLTLSGSTLYGTTEAGGGSHSGTVFKINTNGTGYTVLKNFTYNDGLQPYADLTLSGSRLYGTTFSGGSSNLGTVFKVNTDGTGYTVLRHFTYGSSDGVNPWAGLTLSGSTLYGTTPFGGDLDHGTVFRIDLSIPLTIDALGDAVVLSWADPGFALQAAPTVSGGYTNVPGATSPHTNTVTEPQQFFRLIGN